MKKFILTIAGGGSTYTPGIIKSLLLNKEKFCLQEIRMYDIDGERQNKVAIIVKKIVEEMSPEVKLVVTTDPKVAMHEADFVFAQMRVGKYKMREFDEKIPLKYDVIGQETCGPGGLAYGLRTIFPMVELVDFVEKYAKKTCWIVNYSNPASIVAEAVKRLRPTARVMNICDMPVGTMRNMAAILGCNREDLTVEYFGLNHFGWFTKAMVKGEDKIEILRKHTREHGLLLEDMTKIDSQHSDPSWLKTYRNLKYIVDMFPEYIPNPYMQYYLLSDYIVANSNKERTRANEVMEGREKKLFDAIDHYNETKEMDLSSFYVGVHGQFIVDVAMSLAFDLRTRVLAIVENKGAISNLPYDAMVEIPAYITCNGPEPIRIGEIPTFYKGLIEQELASEKLVVDAAIENSYEKALMGFTMNKTIKSSFQAKKILDEFIEANSEYWPELK
ncbi:6-phospho-alpha-glucosidase [Clostridium sp. CF012]|uniref:6-phospho-alpha-glucosidase n=1 Tax=Clostridium sp. CF012 TaxID=2843319 RepID=UPI001C0CD2CA|nr:6-phospho-alpha-glucosidase [Clostridium sp. CF012]MBU3143258.1 6-phospho-alpha-glucosidase [Clostridium sp. CF012]